MDAAYRYRGTAVAATSGHLPARTEALPLASEPVVLFVQIVFVVGFFGLSLVAGHRLSLRAYADARVTSRALIPMAMLSMLFTVAGIVLLNLPMGMRHGM